MNNGYDKMKDLPWSLIQPALVLVHIVGLLLPSRRAMTSLALQVEQLMLLVVFLQFYLAPNASAMLFSLQFSQFKLLDYTFSTGNRGTSMGYFSDFMNNAYILVVLLVVSTLVCLIF